MRFIGIDPGLGGAIGVLPDNVIIDTPTVALKKGRGYLVASMVEYLRPYKDDSVVIIENPPLLPGKMAMALGKLQRNVGQWEAICATLGIPYDLVDPATWKKAMGIAGDKQNSIIRAQQLFPWIIPHLTNKDHDGRAESVLLAEYRRRLEGQSA